MGSGGMPLPPSCKHNHDRRELSVEAGGGGGVMVCRVRTPQSLCGGRRGKRRGVSRVPQQPPPRALLGPSESPPPLLRGRAQSWAFTSAVVCEVDFRDDRFNTFALSCARLFFAAERWLTEACSSSQLADFFLQPSSAQSSDPSRYHCLVSSAGDARGLAINGVRRVRACAVCRLPPQPQAQAQAQAQAQVRAAHTDYRVELSCGEYGCTPHP